MSAALMGDSEFAELCVLLEEVAGLSFDAPRRDSLSYSVGERLAATATPDVPAYLSLLRGPGGPAERQALLDEVTIPETHFFRNPPQVRALRQFVLPELVRHAAAAPDRALRVWSAGCSTGEEPYTVGILLRELLPANPGLQASVLATDLSTKALAAARAATYGERALHLAEPVDRARWFVPRGNEYQVRDEVREVVEFRHHNLVTQPPPCAAGEVDLILCRNVTIYFGRDTTRSLIRRLHGCLRDGGYLFLGHAETLWQISDDFQLVSLGDAFVYRRNDGGDRRQVLPDRRTADDGPPPPSRERRTLERRSAALDFLVKARSLPFPRAAAAVAAPPPTPTRVAPHVAPHVAPVDPLDTVRAAIAGGRYAEAADLAEEVATATPLRADAYYLRGLALCNLGLDADALVSLRKAVYLDPKAGLAHFLLGGALERIGEPRAAARCYRAAAQTLVTMRFDAVVPELGGRGVVEIAALCRRLAEQADVAARSAG
ncbi:MAG TPA: CheR family methyltransferase [Mycobacteriales bacterium]|nr:CheR family methyltransferase [Mycobacteriales bacterium]